jgi:hypothetical protein
MSKKKSPSLVASAVSLALSSMMLSAGVNAANVVGAIDVSQPYEIYPTGALSWNQENVSVFKVVNGVEATVPFAKIEDPNALDVFDPINTLVTTLGDSFVSKVYSDLDVQTARVTGKVYPVGGPTGIKAVINDNLVKNGKPVNCLINTSFLGENPAVPNDLDQHLDDPVTAPVICSSFFQSHKRFKVAMLPPTVATVDPLPIDLVFNVDDDMTLTPYQVFSKINNYTEKRLKGYKVQVGRGVGTQFVPASKAGIASQLYISLGIDEGLGADGNLDGTTDLFEGDDGLATFSHGLFGANDLYLGDKSRWPLDGYFDNRTAGFSVTKDSMSCVDPTTCANVSEPTINSVAINMLTADTILSTTALDSNYTVIDNPDSELNGKELFGDWLPGNWAPKGVFFDDDGDPTTDAVLVAWWDGTTWRKGNRDDFVPVSEVEFNTWTVDKGYSIDVIEDTVNLGINYIVKVGAINDPAVTGDETFTIRIVPIVADSQVAPAWVGTEPTPLLATSPSTTIPIPTSSDGGGCTVGGSGRFDPTLPALLAMGLGFFGWRRFKAGK